MKVDRKMYELQEKAIAIARNILVSEFHYAPLHVAERKMYVVWFCKTLQNWKALVSGEEVSKYIEITYNGDKQEAYIDIYDKAYNACVKDDDFAPSHYLWKE